MVCLAVVALKDYLAITVVLLRNAQTGVLLYACHTDALAFSVSELILGDIRHISNSWRLLIERHRDAVKDNTLAGTRISRNEESRCWGACDGVVQSVLKVDVCALYGGNITDM